MFGVDRLMSTCTALTNVIGNTLAVFVIARWEGAFAPEKLDAYLAQQSAGLIDPSGSEEAPPPLPGLGS
jgi:aerobic C4-dicarboxylate transport protein